MSKYGNFAKFCADSTLPVCNLFLESGNQFLWAEKTCTLEGLKAGDGRIRNLGSIILCALAVLMAVGLILLSEKKKAAVGRREMQILLVFYIVMSIAEIFSVGGFLTGRKVLIWTSAIHIGAIVATAWVLMINAIVGFQLIDDGTMLSVGLTVASGLAFLVGVGFIGIAAGFAEPTKELLVTNLDSLKHIPLYTLYLLLPLLLIVIFFVLESVLVIGILQETKPMVFLSISALFFAIGQIFQFVISKHLCTATSGKIDGALFETLFTLLSVGTLWYFWSSITEDDWAEDPLNGNLVTEHTYA